MEFVNAKIKKSQKNPQKIIYYSKNIRTFAVDKT